MASRIGPNQNGIPKSEYNFRLNYLKIALREHEEYSRTNSGSTKGGLRLADGSTWEFAKYCLETAWRTLAELQTKNPEEYALVISGQRGQYWPVTITCAHYAALTKFSRPERVAMRNGGANPYGAPLDLKNATKTVYNLRRKLTGTAVLTHANGNQSRGFDLFRSWTGIDASGNPNPDGRNGCIGEINLMYVFANPNFAKTTDNEPVMPLFFQPFKEEFSPISLTDLNKKIEERESGIFSDEKTDQPLNAETKTNQNDQKSVKTFLGDLPAATPETRKKIAAFDLWKFILTRIYVPMLLAKRVRFAKNIYTRAEFSAKTQENAISDILELFEAGFSPEQLHAAAEKHAAWMEANPKTYIYTPKSFLNPNFSGGTLVTALRELEARPDLKGELPDDTTPETEPETRIIEWVHRMGAKKTRLFTIRRWVAKYGAAHMLDVCRAFQAKLNKKRAGGCRPGEEFSDTDKAFARLVFYGSSEMAQQKQEQQKQLLKQVRATATAEKWAPYYTKLAVIGMEELRSINQACQEVFGISFKSFSEVRPIENAVLFAYLMEKSEQN
jgi:hypothetical protein